MVTIERGFPVEDLNNYKLVTERREREENGKKVVTKHRGVEYKNPKLRTIGWVKRMTQENAPDVLKNVEVFEIPNPYNMNKKEEEDGHFHNIGWNPEQAVLALKEGYADGFYFSGGFFGHSVKSFKVVDPIQAVKVREHYLKDYAPWIEQIEKNPFSYVATITSPMWTYEIGTSKDPEDDINPENVKIMIGKLKEWDAERSKDYEPDEFDKGSYEDRAKKLLEHVHYCPNNLDFYGNYTANKLEFDTFKEAAEKAKWLRRPEGGYSGEDYINDGAELVNHGFHEWLLKQKPQEV